MNNKGNKDEKVIVVIIVIALLLGLLFWFSSTSVKTILEHKQPADISAEEKGTGLDLRLYDKDGNEIEIPDWFATATESKIGTFTIVRHPPAPPCTTRTQCSGYETNPNIGCWNGKCVLQEIASMNLGISVTNPSASEVSFLNVAPSVVTPTLFNTNLDKTAESKLTPGETVSWGTSVVDGGVGPMSVSAWEGTQQTFFTKVSGTNEFTGQIFSAEDSITLAFDADPATEGFTVSIVSPVPT